MDMIEIDDKSHSKMLVEMRRLDHSLRNWQCDIILNGGDFGYTPGNEDVSAFTSVDADYDIIYNVNKFDKVLIVGQTSGASWLTVSAATEVKAFDDETEIQKEFDDIKIIDPADTNPFGFF